MMNDEHYDQVGQAIRERRAVHEAFCAILRHDFHVARRALAQAESEHYGLKPWTQGTPTRDVCGRTIVFRDQEMGRFTIPLLRPDGSHIRVPIPDAEPYQLGRYEAWALTVPAAAEIGLDWGLDLGRTPRRIEARASDLWHVIRFDIGRSLD